MRTLNSLPVSPASKGCDFMNKWWTAFFQALAAFAGSVLGSFTGFLS